MEARILRNSLSPRSQRVVRGAFCAAVFSAFALSSSAEAQDLGAQRIATASGTFLKIGLDARGAALAGSYNTLAEGAAATFYNPAGIAVGKEESEVFLSYIAWPAGINVGALSLTRPVPQIGGRFAIGVAFLATDIEETTEYSPFGTGRKVGYSDILTTLSFSRLFTDRLSIGASAKFFYEDLASNVGGSQTTGILFDAGTNYELGYRNSRLAITLSHFGPDLEPDGSYFSSVSEADVAYTAYSPPTMFNLGFSIDAWNSGPHRLTFATQIVHPADQNETLLGATEYWYSDRYAVRTGYDFAADEFGFSAGLGVRLRLAGRDGTIDYAYTEGGNLEAIHRWGMGFQL